jgi:hypothetical protein
MIGGAVAGLLRRPWLGLGLVLVVETAVFAASQGDFVAADPLWYADIAHRIAFDPSAVFDAPDNHPFLMRVGLTVPLALLYRAFGVSTPVTNLLCLAAALGVVLVVYAAARTPRAKLLGMLFCLGCSPLMRAAGVLGPDLPCAALMACSILWLAWRDRPRGAAWVTAAAIAWFAAFLVKESALWCGPIWLYAIVRDLRDGGVRRTASTFAPALAVGAALAAGYLVLCARVWGDPWARFAGVEHLGHAWQLQDRPASEWVARLTWQPARMFLHMYWATLIPAALAPWLVRGPDRLWWVATAVIVLLFWFGSSSRLEYSPLPILPRMAAPALPCILVVATLAGDRALDRPRRWWRIASLAVAAAVLIQSALTIHLLVARDQPEAAAYRALRDDVADRSRRIVLVCADPSCPSMSDFYFGFEAPPNLTIALATDFARAPLPEGVAVRAFVNVPRSTDVRDEDPRLDRSPQIEALALPPIVWRPRARLYDAGDGRRLWEALRAAP